MSKTLRSDFKTEFSILRRSLRRVVVSILWLALAGYLLSGIYLVRTGDTGVVKRFGQVKNARVTPGMHYRLPWPFETVVSVATGEIRDMEAGFGAPPEEIARFEQSFGNISTLEYGTLLIPYCITGDRNIIHLNVVAQYQIVDPDTYLHLYTDPKKFLLRCVQQKILESAAKMQVDVVLLTGKAELQLEIAKAVQHILSEKPCGLRLVSLNVKRVRPPQQVTAAFKDVIDAQEERVTALHDAEAYRNQLLPDAKAQASRIIAEAEAYHTTRVSHAQGEAQRFELLLDESLKHPDLQEKRLYLDAMENLLSQVDKYVLDCDDDGEIVDYSLFIPGVKEAQ